MGYSIFLVLILIYSNLLKAEQFVCQDGQNQKIEIHPSEVKFFQTPDFPKLMEPPFNCVMNISFPRATNVSDFQKLGFIYSQISNKKTVKNNQEIKTCMVSIKWIQNKIKNFVRHSCPSDDLEVHEYASQVSAGLGHHLNSKTRPSPPPPPQRQKKRNHFYSTDERERATRDTFHRGARQRERRSLLLRAFVCLFFFAHFFKKKANYKKSFLKLNELVCISGDKGVVSSNKFGGASSALFTFHANYESLQSQS